METLFAPWRLEYLMSEKSQGCILCDAIRDAREENSLLLHKGAKTFAILNRYPYANGHVMVAPRAHQATLWESDPETLSELMEGISIVQRALAEVYRPAGSNVGANFGRAGGAGVEDHYHFHVVPRWPGDVNFITVTGQTRVVPEDLLVTRDRLRPRIAALAGKAAG